MVHNKRLKRENVEDITGLTPMQQGMLFHYLKDIGSGDYLEQLSFRIKGAVCIETLKEAWNAVAVSNEALRTVFRWGGLEKPIQVILKNVEVPVSCIDATDLEEQSREAFICQIREQDVGKGIDISEEPLRITVITFKEDEIEMVMSYHHILLDGWSTAVLIKEFIEAYEAISCGAQWTSGDKLKYKEYVKWQLQNKEGQLEYWKSYLEGYEGKAVIPQDNSGQEAYKGNGKFAGKLGGRLVKEMKWFCQAEKVTMATLIHAAWGILLQRYNNKEDVVFGTTVSGRTAKLKGIESAVGLYINTLPFRVKAEDKETVDSLLQRMEREIREREGDESISLAELQSDIAQEKGTGLFDTLLVIENYPIEKQIENSNGKIKLKISNVRESTNYDLTIVVMLGDGVKINIYYKQDKYRLETIKRLVSHLEKILQEIIKDSRSQLSHIEMISEEEKAQLIQGFNKTEKEYDRKKTIQQIFEEKAEESPDSIAVVYEDKQLTYRELNEKANRLARVLRDKGVGPDSAVGIMVERSTDMVTGIIGILKAGGAYLPIDPEYPEDRIAYMLEDSSAKILLTHTGLSKSCRFEGDIIDLEDKGLLQGNTQNLESVNSPGDLAYILYTSGSTGRPKGVMVEHRGVINTLTDLENICPLEREDAYLLKTVFTFDVSVIELFGWFIGRGRLVILPQGDEKDAKAVRNAIIRNNITHINFVPSMLNIFIDELESNEENELGKLKYVIAGGEALRKESVKRFEEAAKGLKMVNIYGPTEATIYATSFTIEQDKAYLSIPIGRPIQNTKVYITDKNGQIQPVGIPGELCIAGEGLARGYLNRPELTAERFVTNPFLDGKRLYRTGDLAKWLPDGNIEYLGRMDHQVKIRGYRVELGEIESRLTGHKAIKEAVVTAKEDDSGSPYLCAYIAVDKQLMPEGGLTVAELLRHLSEELPEYMLPACFVQLDNIPLNHNGKIDRGALPEPVGNIGRGTSYSAARNRTEQKLVEIWQKVLGIENIGIFDNFFELGGHSLKAIQIVNQIHKVLNIQVGFKEFFDYQTIASLAEYIKNREGTDYEQIEQLPQQEHYALSYAQQRLWIINQKEPENTAYNMAGRMLFKESMNIQAVEKAFGQLIERHEGLRTRFASLEGIPVQIIEDHIDFKVTFRDLSLIEKPEMENEREAIYTATSEHIFRLEKAPLLIAELVKLKETEYGLFICMHHIVSDGWSMNLLREEFIRLYQANRKGINIEMAPLGIQYKDFAAWQNRQIESSRKMETAKSYWYEQLRNNPSPLGISHREQGEALIGKTGETRCTIIEKDIK
ncbi:MAG TPA: amino acid adenylation domain-containing protein, partial [Clostridia bacterium]|nr:amino acid adenylation domain-containing protein [Clostridia bacterium]